MISDHIRILFERISQNKNEIIIEVVYMNTMKEVLSQLCSKLVAIRTKYGIKYNT